MYTVYTLYHIMIYYVLCTLLSGELGPTCSSMPADAQVANWIQWIQVMSPNFDLFERPLGGGRKIHCTGIPPLDYEIIPNILSSMIPQLINQYLSVVFTHIPICL